MEISWNRGTFKSSTFNGIYHYKPSIWGYPHLWKPPYYQKMVQTLRYCFIHRLRSDISCAQKRQKRPVVHVYEVSDGRNLRRRNFRKVEPLELEMTKHPLFMVPMECGNSRQKTMVSKGVFSIRGMGLIRTIIDNNMGYVCMGNHGCQQWDMSNIVQQHWWFFMRIS